MTLLYCISHITRAYMRSQNPVYVTFIKTLRTASISTYQKTDNEALQTIYSSRDKLRKSYDYDFKDWPVDFVWSDGLFQDRVPKLLPLEECGGYPGFDGPFVKIVSNFMASTVGRCMLYPGSVGLLQTVLHNALQTGRNFLIEKKQAKRYKLLARDNNSIDCVFVDKRNTAKDDSYSGNILVICSEGNAGFYEIGIMSTPLEKEHSVMGWNHPGFGGSSGTPYPVNDINAIDVVINFATTKLGFKLKNIYLFGWSIGGFPSAWAAAHYPEIKGIFLDASFDDVLPLARARMMPLLIPMVDHTIRYHFNLNISAYLNHYKGPVRLIRRLQDEIIAIDSSNRVSTNCGNNILHKLLSSRFPLIMQNDRMKHHLDNWLSNPFPDILLKNITEEQALEPIRKYIIDNDIQTYPINIPSSDVTKETIYYLASLIMKNYNSSHCTPLPSSFFVKPFDFFAK